MNSAVLLFAARILLLLLLYLFLYVVVRALRQDLRSATRQPAAGAPQGTAAHKTKAPKAVRNLMKGGVNCRSVPFSGGLSLHTKAR